MATDEIARGTGRRAEVVLNAAVTGGDVIAADFVLAQMLDRGARPTLVVLEVSPDTLNHRTYWLRYHVIRQFTWRDVPRYAGDMIALRDTGTLLLSRLLPLYYHRQSMLAGVAPAPPARQLASGSGAGVLPSVPSLSPEQLALSRAGVAHARLMLRDFHIGGRPAEALERILCRCDSIGARVLLVGVPVTAAFRTAHAGDRRRLSCLLDDVVRRHGCCLSTIATACRRFFVDVHHLSAEVLFQPAPAGERFRRIDPGHLLRTPGGVLHLFLICLSTPLRVAGKRATSQHTRPTPNRRSNCPGHRSGNERPGKPG